MSSPASVGDGREREDGEADDVRGARRARVLERPFAEPRLDQLEVGEARQAPAPAERQAERELERQEREQPPPAGDDGDERERSDHRLVEPWRARVDHGQVAVRIGRPDHRFPTPQIASFTIPAPTVSLVASSIRMNAPVVRFRS